MLGIIHLVQQQRKQVVSVILYNLSEIVSAASSDFGLL